ncbi:MAG TPA: cytochrome b/b6 domain-containing protein [Bauldia sp.]|nr:cytochrome b/b6 domain-containing protein [Bauldia sp.]
MTNASVTRPTISPGAYSLSQVVLHWTIAALVLWQLFVAPAPNETLRMARRGLTPSALDTFLASSHVWVGSAVLALVVIRLVLRVRRPPPELDEPNPLLAFAARASHFLFYALLFFMPLTGIASWFFGLPVGGLHEAGQPVFVGLIAIHVAASLWHQFVRRDGVLSRMLVPSRT